MLDLNFNKLGLTQRAEGRIYFGVPEAGVQAAGSVTILDYTLLALATVSLDGNDLVEGTDWTAGTDEATTATSLAAALDGISGYSASAVGAVITITADAVGVAGNVTLTTDGDAEGITLSGAALTGGVDADTIDVNGSTFTYVDSSPGANEFSDITELEALVEAVSGITSAVVSADGYIRVQASAVGTAGNAITLELGASNVGTMTISGDTLEGGVAASYSDWVQIATDDGEIPEKIKGTLVVANIGGTSPHVVLTPQFSDDKENVTDGTAIDVTSNGTTAIDEEAGKVYARFKVVLSGADVTADVKAHALAANDVGNVAGTPSAAGDTEANPTITGQKSYMMAFTGSVWARVRSGITGAVSSVLGYLNTISVGTYNATPPTLTDGQSIEPQVDENGNLKTTLADGIAGERIDEDVLAVEHQFQTLMCTADTLVHTGAGLLGRLTFSCNDAAPTGGTISVYDGIDNSGTLIYSETFDTTPFRGYSVILDRELDVGLYLDFTTTTDINVVPSYRG